MSSTADILKSSHEVLYEGKDDAITIMSLHSLLVGISERLSTIETKVTQIDKVATTINSLVGGFGQLKIKVEKIETSIKDLNKRCDKQDESITSVRSNNSELQRNVKDLEKEIKSNTNDIKGMGNLFDDVKSKQENNGKEVKQLRSSISKVANDLEDHTQETKEEVKSAISDIRAENDELRETVLDLQCRSMKYNLIFKGLNEQADEDTENLIRSFIRQELNIKHRLELGNVHRFGTSGTGRGHSRPIIARFLYNKDLELVLSNTYRLKGTRFSVNRQFPEAIEQARRSLYPVMKEKRRQGHHTRLVRDVLYVDGLVYQDEMDISASASPRNTYARAASATPDDHRPKRKRITTPRHR